jgi:hypothetical protein
MQMPCRVLAPAATSIAIGLLGACTLAHPLEGYGDGAGVVADAASSGDGGVADAREGSATDAGDGCSGDPHIVAPASGAVVGASVRLVVSGPSCLERMILYVDDTEGPHFVGNSIDQDVPIALGTHRLNVNAWAGTAQAHQSAHVTITRAR